MSESSYKRAEVSFVIFIIVIIAVFFSWFFVALAHKGSETKKQIELRSLADAITIYEIREGFYPENVAGFKRWCQVGQLYRGYECLGELVDHGHIKQLPSSNDSYPYLYRYIHGSVMVATAVDVGAGMPPEQNTCYGNLGELLWCYEVR